MADVLLGVGKYGAAASTVTRVVHGQGVQYAPQNAPLDLLKSWPRLRQDTAASVSLALRFQDIVSGRAGADRC